MANLAQQLKKEREGSLKEKYAGYLNDICDQIRKNGVAIVYMPNDCDTTANNLSEFLGNEGFSVKRIMYKPWHPGSFTKYIEVRA